MAEILIIPAMLVFSLFLVLGVTATLKNAAGKWIYFSLSVLFFIGAFLLFAFPRLYSSNSAGEKNHPPKTVDEQKPPKSGGGKTDPEHEKPPVTETPEPEKPPKTNPDPSPTKPSTKPQKIVVPENETIDYKVIKGDTLWGISTRSGKSVEKLKQWNSLKSDVIYVGQILKLYGKNVEPKPPVSNPPIEPTASVLVTHGDLQKKEIALTFDAGSDAAGIQILDVLKKYNLKATFFLTGSWVEKFPVYAKRIANEGHDIGNHTYSHPDALKSTASAFTLDVLKAEQAIKTVTGKTPRPYFRFPYGSYNSSALKTVGSAGYALSIQWSLDTIDWQQPSVDTIVSRIEDGASNGDIILMHIGGINTPAAVDKVIPILQAKGYKLVTLTELLQK